MKPLRLVVLISGAGTTLANLIARIADGRLPGVRIVQVISSRAAVGGVEIAQKAGLPVTILRRRDFVDSGGFSGALTAAIDATGADLVVMAGFLCLWKLPSKYVGRVINIHPALLPGFGGRGFFGAHVHEAVLRSGVSESGCTVHQVDDEYDHGPILAQRRVPVLPGDTVETLAARVGQAERELLPEVIRQIAIEQGTIRLGD